MEIKRAVPSICIVICYYGKFPETFQMFLDSCAYNPLFNWLIVTDSDEMESYSVPGNVQILQMNLNELETLASEKIGYPVLISTPRKLCDYKPAYGLIFEDYLIEYEWWGYGDIDLVYGDLSKYFTKERLEKFDKIYPLGHLSVMRNNMQCKHAFELDSKKTRDAKDVYSTSEMLGFCEHDGVNQKMTDHKMRMDLTIEYADRVAFCRRFCTVWKGVLPMYFRDEWAHQCIPLKNYRIQVFAWEQGRAFQYYVSEKQVMKKELCYIHYRYPYTKVPESKKQLFFGADIITAPEDIRTPTRKEILKMNPPDGLDNFWKGKEFLRIKISRSLRKIHVRRKF